jgi:acetyltransferase-like isoleucine patch superfamily enzyme
MSSAIESFVLRVKRAETPGFKRLKATARWLLTANVPIPRALRAPGRLLYHLRFFLRDIWYRIKSLVWFYPLFACRCEAIGKRVQLVALPEVSGHTHLYVGDDVRFSGNFGVTSGRFCAHPTLRIGNRSFLGHNVAITCNREVVIEDDVLVAAGCTISDYDGHARDLERRVSDMPPGQDEMLPVRICRGAWIGSRSMILKGVTVGEGAIAGALSVVTHDVPAHSLVVGAPARVVNENQRKVEQLFTVPLQNRESREDVVLQRAA